MGLAMEPADQEAANQKQKEMGELLHQQIFLQGLCSTNNVFHSFCNRLLTNF